MATRGMWIVSGALVLLTACGTPSDTETGPQPDSRAEPSVSLVGDTIVLELPIGTSASDGEITVQFDAVTSDSRCPTDVQCVWEGNAGIRLTLESADERTLTIVNSAIEPQWVGFLEYAIGFRDLAPYPTSVDPTDPADYVATVAILDRGDYTAPPSARTAPSDAPSPGNTPDRRYID